MVDSTHMNGANGPFVSDRSHPPDARGSNGSVRGIGGRGMREGVSDVARHVLELSVLQSQLTSADLREAWGKASVPLACLGAAATFGLAALPVILLGVGLWLAAAWGVSQAAGLLIVGAVVVIVAAACGWIAWRKLQAAMCVLQRSKTELLENVASIRDTLAGRDVE